MADDIVIMSLAEARALGPAAVKARTALMQKADRQQNPEKHKSQKKSWIARNPERHKEARRRAHRRKRRTPAGVCSSRVRKAIKQAFRKITNEAPIIGHISSRLGYSAEQLRRHLESQFLPGMSWDNRAQWHIDHIRPLASFSYTTMDDPEFKQAWALNNLRPLWAIDNMKKGSKWDGELGHVPVDNPTTDSKPVQLCFDF